MPTETKGHARHGGGRNSGGVLVAAGAVALASGALALAAWARPVTVAGTAPYDQTMTMTYGAQVAPGSVYGPSGLRTGQPVYTSVVKKLDVGISYRFSSPYPARVSGTARLSAVISDGQGISQTLLSTPLRHFQGDQDHLSAQLEAKSLQEAAGLFERTAGTFSGQGYTVSLLPVFTVRGRVDGRAFTNTFSPSVQFSYGGAVLSLEEPSGQSSPPEAAMAPAPGGGLGPVARTSTGSVSVPGARRATLLWSGLPVAKARWEALALFALALSVSTYSGLSLWRRASAGNEPVRIATRYGATLVEVDALPSGTRVAVVELSTFGGLAQVARRLECPLLHRSGVGDDTYAVVDSGTLYLYRTGAHPAPGGRHLSAAGALRGPELVLPVDGGSRQLRDRDRETDQGVGLTVR